MKNKLFLKASALVCSLALVVTGLQTAFAADRDYTLKKTYTVENASSVSAVKLYEVYCSNYSLIDVGQLTAEGGDMAYSTTQQYDTFLGAVAKLDDVDLTASDIDVDEWSYKIVGNIPTGTDDKVNMFGYLYNWTKVGSTVSKTEDGYTVTDGDTGFQTVNSNIRIDDNGYTFLKMAVTPTVEWDSTIQGSNITVTDEGATANANGGSGNHNQVSGIYWLGAPTVEVSYVNNGNGTHTYTVKAVNIYTKSNDEYTAAADKVLRTFNVTDGSEQDTGLVMLGTGRYLSNSKSSNVKFTDIKVKYNKTTDYTADCEQFLTANPIVETLYEGTFAPTADNAEDLKAQLNTALSKYNALADEVKTVFDSNFANFADKVAAALSQCNRAAYGTVTVDKTVDAVAESVDVATVYAARNNAFTGEASYAADGSGVKYTVGNANNATLGAITEIKGVDLTSSDVSVKGWSYTMEFGQNGAPLGFLESWKNFNTVISKDNGSWKVTPGDGTFYKIYGVQTVAYESDNNYQTILTDYGIGKKIGQFADCSALISVNDGTATVTTAPNINGKKFIDSNEQNLYWKGNPVITVSMTENTDGETYTYTVTAKDLYYSNGTSYGDFVLVNNTSAVNPGYVLLGAGNYGYNYRVDKTISFKDIKVKYTSKVDITDDCIAVLESGNGMIERLDGIVTAANAAQVSADVAALKAAYNAASGDVKSAIDAKYAGLADKIAYAEKYADVAATKASPELLGINIKKVTSASASDLRFAVSYVADSNTDYTIKGYGAIVVPNQVKADKKAELTKNTAVLAGQEGYFVDVYENATSVAVDANNQFYVNINNSKGKPGTLFDCRPYVVYTDGTDEFIVYASNSVADKNIAIANGQASKCIIFAARDMSNAILAKDGYTAKYPDGCDKDAYNAIINKIGRETTTSQEKNLVFQFLYENYTALV